MDNVVKYVCPKCKQELSYIRYVSGKSECYGVTIKCKKCCEMIEIKIKPTKSDNYSTK